MAGPTAVGKTEVAIALARRRPISIISIDSAMVYRGMDIGTAKPNAALLESYPHALVDIRDPLETYSAAEFLRDADAAVRQAWQLGRLPVLVGGTMLYLRTFREGLAAMPGANVEVRRKLNAQAAATGWNALYERLCKIDPVAAAKIHPNNHSRLQRALEVYELSGRPISQFWAGGSGTDAGNRLGAKLLSLAIEPDDRAVLHGRIEQRYDAMLEAGFLAEVAGLRDRGDLDLSLPALRAVGYRQAWEHLDGSVDADGMRRRTLAATRQLAKRQLTWLRGWPWMKRLTWGEPAQLAAEIEHQLT
ncbi:MAG: tRNA (adenosine(37)-N6)-dimethylallyltransferase MiaA [Gammaproteobacteria bacterium]|nr:tRNA (adenosine(37)-N6)-dimethylallyltransferase MiaA [Gammaproteobacteria bacterium]